MKSSLAEAAVVLPHRFEESRVVMERLLLKEALFYYRRQSLMKTQLFYHAGSR
jgi:hypothetical protein